MQAHSINYGRVAHGDDESGLGALALAAGDRIADRNIASLEVDSVMRRHPAMEGVAAFAITAKQVDSEQELKLNSISREGHKPGYEDLCPFIDDNAPHCYVPRCMEFVDSLPYTPTNKVQKYLLRQHSWDLKKIRLPDPSPGNRVCSLRVSGKPGLHRCRQ